MILCGLLIASVAKHLFIFRDKPDRFPLKCLMLAIHTVKKSIYSIDSLKPIQTDLDNQYRLKIATPKIDLLS